LNVLDSLTLDLGQPVKVVIEEDEEVGGFVVSCPGLPGCFSQGDTMEEAVENIKEAI